MQPGMNIRYEEDILCLEEKYLRNLWMYLRMHLTIYRRMIL